MRRFEQSIGAVSRTDLSDDEKLERSCLVNGYVFGFSPREARESAEHERGFSAVREYFQRELDSGDYPHIREFLGLDRLLAGTEATCGANSASGAARRGESRA